MAYSQPVGAAFLDTRARSQSDSDLLAPKPNQNGLYGSGSLKRNSSMDEISRQTKRKGFFYRLVRPWKWRKPKRNKSKDKLRVDDSRSEFRMNDVVVSFIAFLQIMCL